MNNNSGRIKFVSGNGAQPEKVTQKFFNQQQEEYQNLEDRFEERFEDRFGENSEERLEENLDEKFGECPPEEMPQPCDDVKWERKPCDNPTTIDCRKMFFCKGAENWEDFVLAQQMQEDVLQQPQFAPSRPQPSAVLAREIYVKMLVLGEMYRDLRRYDTSFSDELQDMIEELNVVTFAMGRIYQQLSRSNRLPSNNQRVSRSRDFCSGVQSTSRYLRGLMFDLRRLQRSVDGGNLQTQLLIINITLMSHQQQLQEMRRYCTQ